MAIVVESDNCQAIDFQEVKKDEQQEESLLGGLIKRV